MLPSARPLSQSLQRSFHSLKASCESEWLVIMPDKPGVLDRRLAIRPKHSPNFARLHNEGHVTWAGPLFERHTYTANEKRPFKGSVIVFKAKSPAEIIEKIKSDPYITEQIWDLKRAEFIPFTTHFRSDS